MMPLSAQDVHAKVGALQSRWVTRNKMMQEWYQAVQLKDYLQQENMESVISNDPRTGFNMASWLLTPKVGRFTVDGKELFNDDQLRQVAALENFSHRELLRIQRRSGFSRDGDVLERALKLALLTGWYCLFTMPTSRGWLLKSWNPATVFPEYDPAGNLIGLGRRVTMNGATAQRVSYDEGWEPFMGQGKMAVTMSQYWWISPEGVKFCTAIGNVLSRPETVTEFYTIPVFIAPVGGLPDDGAISGTEWYSEIGQSFIHPIHGVIKNFNKMMTYLQQLLRDTANPRWVEKVKREGVLTPDRLFVRGAVFSIEPDEDIGALQMPPIPAEMQTHLFALRNQIQRGSFSDAVFGNVSQAVSTFMMAQIVAGSQQVLEPFKQGVCRALSFMATFNTQQARYIGLPSQTDGLPDLLDIWYDYDIQIPGDFLQRANAARILNPTFRLPTETILEQMFPEIQSVAGTMGKAQAETALNSPYYQAMLLAKELEGAALMADKEGDTMTASRARAAVKKIEAEVFGMQQQSGGQQTLSNDAVVQLMRGM